STRSSRFAGTRWSERSILTSDHLTAAREAGWSLTEMKERLVDDRWLALKPKWGDYRNLPVSFAMVWRKV
ncbi:MAG: hypothetical protein ACREQY_04200, partial [Candidatus Binatia bacterium]